jgi:hypothetical protein
MANVIIAVLATVLGFTTSAVVTEVRSQGPAAAPLVAVEIPAQFRPLHAAEPPAFASSSAPGWNKPGHAVALASARAVLATRSVGVER